MRLGTPTVAQAANRWRNHVLAARRAREDGDKYLEVRYEDLLSDGVRTMARVFAHCALDTAEVDLPALVAAHDFATMKAKRQGPDRRVAVDAAHFREGRAGGWRVTMSPLDRYRFDRVAGQLLVELGYAEPGWWARSGLERRWLPVQARRGEWPATVWRAVRALRA
jgi:hypothetical protein